MDDVTDSRPRVLSGIQPTSDSFHLGNYLGALRNWVALQDGHDAFYCVVDLHAITMEFPAPEDLRRRTRVAAAQLLAIGIDPTRSTLFVQSHVPQHTELSWVLNSLTGFGEASRMTQFKDKSARSQNVSVGLFTYPILQAADILLYQAHQVPVGEDQRQHLELTRDLAERFNTRFGQTFVVPEAAHHQGHGEDLRPAGADGQDEQVAAAGRQPSTCSVTPRPSASGCARRSPTATCSSGTTPSDKPGVSNLLTIYSALTGTPIPDLESAYEGKGYGDLKKDLADVVVAWAEPIQEATRAYLDDPDTLDDVLADGAKAARAVAAQTVATVYDRVGFLPAKG